MPFVRTSDLIQYKAAVRDVKSLRSKVNTLESTTIARSTYERIKNNLAETDKELKSAKSKVKHYSSMYFGMKEKYSKSTEKIE